MKKLLVLALIAFTGYTANAQFTAGVSGGLPIGDAGDLATFSIAVDLGYLFDLSDTFKAGPIAGVSHSFGDDITILGTTFPVEDVQFLPVGAGARFSASDAFTLGADLGYAVGINEGNDGGFYYSPRVQYSISDLIDLVLAYRGVSRDGGSWDIISFGFEFGID